MKNIFFFYFTNFINFHFIFKISKLNIELIAQKKNKILIKTVN